ncbi:MAG: class I SAM-dependent methyltransferase [Chloroflexi bacterium]|nr:class I SAM-dependent methyltransferase [Chloroflexota bacterium]
MTIGSTLTADQTQQRDALVERVIASTRGAFDLFALYLGDRLGLYRALMSGELLTSGALAERTGTHERYVREWLEQQTVMGLLEVDNPNAGPTERRFRLPVGHVEPLVHEDSLNYIAPLARLVAGAVSPLPALLDAYRTGHGVPFADYGADLREGQAAINRPAFLHQLAQEWLPTMPDVHARLQADPPARVADVGCGFGWSSIGIARGYPNVLVDGLDLDAPSIHAAREHGQAAGVADRVQFHVRDAADPGLAGRYDLVTAFECIHDLSDPVGVLRAMRGLLAGGGAVLVADERVGATFTPSGNDVEWMMYGWSILHCLPVGLVDPPAVGTGTVLRADTLCDYALAAGFRAVEVLPINHVFFRFYRLIA